MRTSTDLHQQADLGTARREYISSVDKPNKFSRIRKDQLEAARLSNVDESVRRVAEQNKEQLSAWSSFYKQVNDTGGLEDLDSMMDGQSHRAQLSAAIQESGGQTYVETPSKGNSPHPRAHARDARDPGRGGGNVGRRGRGSSVSTTQNSPKRRPSGRSVMMHGHQLAEIQRHLDPALDFNTTSPSRGRGRKDSKEHRPPPKPAKPPGIKTRRPIQPQIAATPGQNYETFLAEPEGFLAAVRKTRSVSTENSGEDVVKATETTSHVTSEVARPELPEEAPNPDTELLDLHSHSGVSTPIAAEKKQSLSSTKGVSQSLAAAEDEGTNDFSKVQQSSPPESSNMAQSTRAAKPPEVSVSTKPVKDDNEKDNTQEKPRPRKVFSSNLPQPQILTPKYSRPQEAVEPKTKLDENNDLLLDFSTTTSVVTTTDNPEKEAVAPSPGVQDLMDLDFHRRSRSPSKSVSVASLQQGPSSNTEAADPEPAIQVQKGSRSTDSNPSSAKALVVSYLQELAFINDTLPSLTGEDADNLNERRKKLVKLISEATESKANENLALITARKASEIVSALESLSIKSAEDSSPVQERQQQAEPVSDVQKQGADVEKPKAAPGSHAPTPKRSRLRQAVLAAPFVPRSSSSRQSPVPNRRRTQTPDNDDHIFGEQNLPGRSRPSSISTTGSVLRAPSTDSNVDYLCQALTDKLTFDAGPPNPSRQAFPAGDASTVDHPVSSTTGGGPFSSPFSHHVESDVVPLPQGVVNTPPMSSHHQMTLTTSHPIPTWPTAPLSETTFQYGANLPSSIPRNDSIKSTPPNPAAPVFSLRPSQPHVVGENQSPAHHDAVVQPSRSLYTSRYAPPPPTAGASFPGFGQPAQQPREYQYQAPVLQQQQQSPIPPTRSLYASRYASTSPAVSPRLSQPELSSSSSSSNQPFARQSSAPFSQRTLPRPWGAPATGFDQQHQPAQSSEYQQPPPPAAAAPPAAVAAPPQSPLPPTRSLYASRYAILPDDDSKKPLR
ncbi:hypothetical protein VTN77DRAFT_1169 [Rasamsonia byssochlamydoides]|uniref:uncharacterized protein n=1 Tax=Rasamsonia byssochlamydoides TaxID=89139 RepID=UPI00374495FC